MPRTKATAPKTTATKTTTNTNAKKSSIESRQSSGGASWGQWRLFATTTSVVYLWDARNKIPIFTSGSGSISAVRRSKDGSVLAVADDHVIQLHKQVMKGQTQSYRLKGPTDASRMLEYTQDGKLLYFTTSAKNAVQVYNVREDRVIESLKLHPSSINTFCMSADSSLLLSSSANPPTVYIENQNLRTNHTLKPKASSDAVVISRFHPTRKTIFLLAFADGPIAAYDQTKLTRGQHIHSFPHVHDPITKRTGIVAADFLPGQQIKVVTGGEDGRICILDFEAKAVIASFLVGAPVATLSTRTVKAPARVGTSNNGTPDWLVAVGTQHGLCCVFDQSGQMVEQEIIDDDGEKVIGLEWIYGNFAVPPIKKLTKKVSEESVQPPTIVKAKKPGKTPKTQDDEAPKPTSVKGNPIVKLARSVPSTIKKSSRPDEKAQAFPQVQAKGTHLNSTLTEERYQEEEDRASMDIESAEEMEEIRPAWARINEPYEEDYMNIFSPIKPVLSTAPHAAPPANWLNCMSAEGQRAGIRKMRERARSGNFSLTLSSPQLHDTLINTDARQDGLIRNPQSNPPSVSRIPRRMDTMSPVRARREASVMASRDEGTNTEIIPPRRAQLDRSLPPVAVTNTVLLKNVKAIRERTEDQGGARIVTKGGLSVFSSFLPNVRKSKPASKRNFQIAEDPEDRLAEDPIASVVAITGSPTVAAIRRKSLTARNVNRFVFEDDIFAKERANSRSSTGKRKQSSSEDDEEEEQWTDTDLSRDMESSQQTIRVPKASKTKKLKTAESDYDSPRRGRLVKQPTSERADPYHNSTMVQAQASGAVGYADNLPAPPAGLTPELQTYLEGMERRFMIRMNEMQIATIRQLQQQKNDYESYIRRHIQGA